MRSLNLTPLGLLSMSLRILSMDARDMMLAAPRNTTRNAIPPSSSRLTPQYDASIEEGQTTIRYPLNVVLTSSCSGSKQAGVTTERRNTNENIRMDIMRMAYGVRTDVARCRQKHTQTDRNVRPYHPRTSPKRGPHDGAMTAGGGRTKRGGRGRPFTLCDEMR